MSNVLENIIVGEFLFEFTSEKEWINKATGWFYQEGASSATTICVDNNGRLCCRGLHFKTASYPVRVYWKRDD